MKTTLIRLVNLVAFATLFFSFRTGHAQNTTYPESIEIDQIVSAEYESARLCQIMKKFDHQLTGFYASQGKTIVVNVEILTQADDGNLPKIVIGTPRRTNNQHKEFNLKEGLNTIPATDHTGGMIYFRFVSNTPNPNGKARIAFASGSEHTRVPHFKKGITTESEFSGMMNNYLTPDVMFSTDDAVVVVSRQAALTHSVSTNKESWLNSIDKILLAEDDISGMSNDDSNPIHHRLSKGIRHLLVEAGTGYMFATNYVTGYCGDAALRRLLTNLIDTNNWGVAHELGHQHQQAQYKPGNFTETTVNIYTLAVQRAFFENYTRYKETDWQKLQTSYFSLPDGERNFHTSSIGVVSSENDGRLMLFEQLHYIFGDDFFKRLHRITREEKATAGTNEERACYLALKACQITGYDLRDYFKAWGFVLTPSYQYFVDEAVQQAGLPKLDCNDQLHLTTNSYKPTTMPIAMRDVATFPKISFNNAAAVNKYCDYSSKTGDFIDTRDGKTYPFKRYGDYEWFMTNLDWDGYDGINESTRGTVGLYGPEDPTGEIYGRYYPTNARTASVNWCPSGWEPANSSLWNNLIENIRTEHNLLPTDIGTCLKCGGDRDTQLDGLWAEGGGQIDETLSNQVGFNILPAGVFNKDAKVYDSGDAPGIKASIVIPSSTWFHEVLTYSNDAVSYINRNSRHHGSVRCVRKAVTTRINEPAAAKINYSYFSNNGEILKISTSLPHKSLKIYNNLGKLVYDLNTNSLESDIPSANWGKGVYIIRVNTIDNEITKKVCKL